jgi:hypothetical protein
MDSDKNWNTLREEIDDLDYSNLDTPDWKQEARDLFKRTFAIRSEASIDRFMLLKAEKAFNKAFVKGALYGIGWMYGDVCLNLDKGNDPRTEDVADIIDRASNDLKLKYTK